MTECSEGTDAVAALFVQPHGISEYQAPNNGVRHVYNWVWAYRDRKLRLIHRYTEDDAPEVTAEPW